MFRGAGPGAGQQRAALHGWFAGVVQAGTTDAVIQGLTDVFIANGCVSVAGLADVTADDVVSTPACAGVRHTAPPGTQVKMVPALITQRRIITALQAVHAVAGAAAAAAGRGGLRGECRVCVSWALFGFDV
jgi:hypothetical protein